MVNLAEQVAALEAERDALHELTDAGYVVVSRDALYPPSKVEYPTGGSDDGQ